VIVAEQKSLAEIRDLIGDAESVLVVDCGLVYRFVSLVARERLLSWLWACLPKPAIVRHLVVSCAMVYQ